MKNYHLLLNQTYLYVLQHPNEKVNYSKIGREVGLTRQTVAKEYQEFSDLENLNCFNIKEFYNEETNKYRRAMMILSDIDDNYYSLRETARVLGVSKDLIYRYFKADGVSCVYGIKYNDQIIYISSTKDFEQCKNQHLANIKNKEVFNKLYFWCVQNHVQPTDVEFVQLSDDIKDKNVRLEKEKALIQELEPICNSEFL